MNQEGQVDNSSAAQNQNVGSEGSQGQNQSQDNGVQNSQQPQPLEGVDAKNFWNKGSKPQANPQGNNQANNQQNQGQPKTNNMPLENQVAMLSRLLEKTQRQYSELEQKLKGGNSQQNFSKNPDELFNQGRDEDGIDNGLKEYIKKEFDSIRQDQFNNQVESYTEKYLQKIPDMPDNLKDSFRAAISNENTMKGLKNGLIGFEDVYRIVTYDALVEKLNSVLSSTGNKANQQMSVGGDGSSSQGNQGTESADDFFNNNPEKALDPTFVQEWKTKRGIK